jgi:hypothetical protein
MSTRIHIITSLIIASVACVWLFTPGAKELALDNIWYIESGKNIYNTVPDVENIIFSPLYSVLAFTWSIYISKSSFALLGEVLVCFLFSAFIWYLLLAVPRFILSSRSSLHFGQNTQSICLVLLAFNPFLLKYSLPIFSDSFSLIAGVLFVFFHGVRTNSLLLSKKSEAIRIDSISRFLLCLYQKPMVYFLMITLMCLLRYGNFFLLVSSLVTFVCTNNRIPSLHSALINRKFIRIFLISILIGIFISVLIYVHRFYVNSCSIDSYFSCISIMIDKLPQKILMVLLLTVGGREGFRWAVDDPMALLNFSLLQKQYLSGGYNISYQEYQLSLAYLIAMLVAFLLSLFGMWRLCRDLIFPYALGISLLVMTEIMINIAHQRYFIPFLPSLYFGLFLFVCYKRSKAGVS